jgi:predicted Zn-ribbon and HTH transcriptional regulator
VAHCPAPAGRPRFDIADIVRRHRPELEAEERLTPTKRKVLSAIERCRTAELGGHLDVCRSCGFERNAYNSCRNRHCPKCQGLTQERWICGRAERLLPVQHFHVVFTLPSELRSLAKFRSTEMFDALFAAVTETLLELGESRLGAVPGITMVLHTWKRDLGFHPHIHALVTAGGISTSGASWCPSSKNYLFPVEVMRALLRGKMMHALRRLHASGAFSRFSDFDDPEAFDRLLARLASKTWVVYAKEPFSDSLHVVRYLGRYTHRIAISNSRLLAVDERSVTFLTKNGETATLSPVGFLRRFLDHVLPDRFHKIRHAGLYARARADALAVARALPSNLVPRDDMLSVSLSWADMLRRLTGRDPDRCPVCGSSVEHVPLARGPPAQRMAA